MSGMLELMRMSHLIGMTRTTKATLDKLVIDSMGYALIHGVLPKTIEDLGSNRTTDAWGNKIDYKVDANYLVTITPATRSNFCEIKLSANCTGSRDDDLYVAARFRTITPQGEYDSFVSEKELKFYLISGQAIFP